jgi:hypothetical protein
MPGTPASDRLASGECRISVANVFSADRLSIAELVLLSEDARTVYASIGIEKVVSGGGVVH